MTVTAYQIACLAVIGIFAVAFLLICAAGLALIYVASWIESEIRKHTNSQGHGG